MEISDFLEDKELLEDLASYVALCQIAGVSDSQIYNGIIRIIESKGYTHISAKLAANAFVASYNKSLIKPKVVCLKCKKNRM